MRRIVINFLIPGLLISLIPVHLNSLNEKQPHKLYSIAEFLASIGYGNNHAAPSIQQKYDFVLEGFPQKIQERMQQQRLAGVSIAIVDGDEIIYSQAFGYADVEKKIPGTRDTIYPIGSVTKVFTATMLMQLCEKGVLNLEIPLKKYLPEYRVKSSFPGVQPTTLGQLASHTSGLPQDAPVNFWCNYSGFGWIVTGGQADLTWYVSKDKLLSSLDQIELEYQPEVYSHYSNFGIQLLGIALERASGQSFVDYVEEQILKPLGMKNSGFMLEEERRFLIAVGHVCTSPQSPFMATPLWEPGCAIYSGGLNSTAEDMARFVSLQFQTAPASKEQILSTGSLRRMRTPNSVRHPGRYTSYGIGWAVVQIEGYDAIEHNGALLGHSTHVSAIPDLRLGIVILSNSRNVLFSPDACKDLAREIYKDLVNEMKEAREEKAFDPSSVNLDQYTGKYELPGGFAEMEITHKEGKLFMTIVQDPGFNEAFVPVDWYEFSFEADPARNPALLFQTDEKGEVCSASFLAYRFKKIENTP
jgi:CubicO group peptidase (beta-lactamase class C family)